MYYNNLYLESLVDKAYVMYDIHMYIILIKPKLSLHNKVGCT